ncbi:hypothetical protein [Nonomuraea jabiensis]|uniref:Lipoprotein n=1 Tax=Nonomuraea jabiensis TaxID=882448 RepID=A0A7W9G0R0_9ACTN|nr:hypothetical protein [Nonomuraea jabiensis]MBB5775100.1 hypothetical protein [Nonomuraea jabiensis]
MPTLVRFTAAALLAVLAAACADSRTAPSTPQSVATDPLPSAADPLSPMPTVSVRPSSTGHRPADGSSLASCRDADCEVEVRAGDRLRIDKRFGVQRLTISALDPDEVTIALLGFTGGLRAEGANVSISSSCVNGRCRDEGKLSLAPGRSARINNLRLELPYASADHAVLRLTSR